MEKLVEVLQQHFTQHPPNYGDAESALDMLFWHYTEYNQIDNEKIKIQFAKLRDYLNLPLQVYDEVFYIVSDLCVEHGRLAFREGIKLVFALLQDLKSE